MVSGPEAMEDMEGSAEGAKGEQREGASPWDPGGHLQAEPGFHSVPPTFNSLLSTTPHSFWVALSKLLNLSGTFTSTTRRKSADLPGTEWCGWVGGPVRRLGKHGSD